MEGKNKKKKSLLRRVIVSQIVMGIVLCVAITSVIGLVYRKEILEDRSAECYGYAHLVSATVDGDRILHYYQTGQKDAYYEEVLKFLSDIQSSENVFCVYIYVPEEHELVYIWDSEEDTPCSLGDRETYMEGGEEILKDIFTKDPVEEFHSYYDDQYGQLTFANYPIFNSEGEPVAVVGVDLSTPEIALEILEFIAIADLCVVLIIILTIITNLYMMNRNIISPIKVLQKATGEMVNDLDSKEQIKIDINNKDEFGELARAYEAMHQNVQDYMVSLKQVTSEKERIASELNVATKIQADMLPNTFPAFPDRKDFDVYATMTPAKEVGGDLYDFFLVDEKHLALVIADVSGKGVPAALFMMIAKTLIKNRTLMGGTPAEILTDVNNHLCAENTDGYFVTVWLAIIDLETGNMTASNAGHEYPVYKPTEKDFELLKRKHSPALGAFDDTIYNQYELQLSSGDRIFVYTDGVPEATDNKEELFGMDNMLASLNQRKEESLESICKGMKIAIDEFVNGATQFDDITMMCFEYKG